MNKYYCLTDESPAYVAAIVLHPSHKWHYVHESWKEWVESSKKMIIALWEDYKPVEASLPLDKIPAAANEFLNWRNKHLQPALIVDEYEHYCQSERVYGFTSAISWLSAGQIAALLRGTTLRVDPCSNTPMLFYALRVGSLPPGGLGLRGL
ncbi:hypothetical protein HIM_11845 [Hirsutella minnesotensis 3608]|uniref:Uncharacterized protein n=1 Tax=Hirsutella minnesotensis 3608 TaxID=1043627 RepID=A0A0F7ZF97_9HYPO|nr:hypothetical protein HIM_11845 [Hirsutella minnesotensis 3608]